MEWLFLIPMGLVLWLVLPVHRAPRDRSEWP